MALLILLILLAYILNAFADAIDHAKGGKRLLTLWHLVKGASYGILIAVILWQMNVSWKVWGLVWLSLWLYWETAYRLFRFFEVYKWDDKFQIDILRKIWKF